MGEAKRRSQPKVTAVIGDLQLAARNAGSPSTYVRKQRAEHPTADRAVPCAGCTECCYTEHLPVDPRQEPPERLARLDTVPTADGKRELRKRADGACVHLGPQGCTVYADRPTICRTYDCRVSALLGLVERYRDGHHAPAWAFESRSIDDQRLLAAFKLGHMRYQEAHPGPADPHRIAESVLANLRKLLAEVSDAPASA
ncbi:MAG: YkgJ family cysteine cluster protein [Alphaproteobacteria bacterium]|nr:YkgJ family cysteine cluster protein [Alphaproteobacteria bacterium]